MDVEVAVASSIHDFFNPTSAGEMQRPPTSPSLPFHTEDVDPEVAFWLGKSLASILRGDWFSLQALLEKSQVVSNGHSYPTLADCSMEAIRIRYGSLGEYRFQTNLDVLREWRSVFDEQQQQQQQLSSAATGLPVLLPSEVVVPVFMVDSVGPLVPIISYNRVVGAHAVLWPLSYHWNLAVEGGRDAQPFAEKASVVVFRGALSSVIQRRGDKASRLEVVDRWVADTSGWVDVGIASVPEGASSQPGHEENEAVIRRCMRPHVGRLVMQHHKYVLCMEGADISSGFGWVLASNCLPLHTHPFSCEVWFFHGLEPWVHFVPIAHDGSDLHEKFLWCEANQERCQRMVEAGRRHMAAMTDAERVRRIKQRVVAAWKLPVT
jgi:Glycosyl transferase family 90